MNYLSYREALSHRTLDFPAAYYWVDERHPRYHMMLHWHPETEILRVRQGRLWLELDGEGFWMQAGDTVTINGGVCHRGEPDGAAYECMVFDLEAFLSHNPVAARQVRSAFSRTVRFVPRIPRGAEEIDGILNGLFFAMREQRVKYELFVQGYLLQWLGVVLREHLYEEVPRQASYGHSQQQALKNAVSFIEQHFAGEITLAQLAHAAGMERKYFCSFFRQMTRQTPIEYLNGYRIALAKERLLTEDAPVAQIALECGFNDSSYFTRLFHRTVGVTPRSYRQQPIGS